jgi:cation:H+ antiporter
MLLWGSLLIIAGVAVMWLAADPFVVAAARLAFIWGLSPVLIGALVIGFGTSAPELLVSGISAARGELEAAVGNVVGSNAANLSLVLGVSALIAPISGHYRTIRREGVVTMAAMVLVVWVMWDDELVRAEGLFLLIGMVIASILLIIWSRRDMASGIVELDIEGVDSDGHYVVRAELIRAAISISAVIAGAAMLNQGGTIVADELGLTGGFIGATVFALGTSLPELVTAIAAARRRANDLVVGNVLGSNIFNSLLVVGSAAVIGPGVLGQRRVSEMVVMLIIGAVAGLFVVTRNRVHRFEGAALLVLYGVFLATTAQMATT